MKQRQQALLERGVEVDHQIAAGQDVEPCERRIEDHVVLGEQDHLTDFLPDQKPFALRLEEATEAFRSHIDGNLPRESSAARRGDRIRIDVACKNLQCPGIGVRLRVSYLPKRHRQGVGLLARRATRDPGPHRRPGGTPGQQRRQHRVLEFLPEWRIAKKTGNADQ